MNALAYVDARVRWKEITGFANLLTVG
jgi:hypothetical protein